MKKSADDELKDKAKAASQLYICQVNESVMGAIEKCLDNGLGCCLVISEQGRFAGTLSLDALATAVRSGAYLGSSVGQHLMRFPYLLPKGTPQGGVLQPVFDEEGYLVDVSVDRGSQFIQVAQPDMTHREFRSLLDAFLSSWISSKGPHIDRFEQEFAALAGSSHGIAVANGTVALHLALVALGIGPGDQVIVPDLTFAATINAVLHCGAEPVIVDVDRLTWCLTREIVERACTPRTKAIIPVHLYGRPAEMGPIREFALSRGIRIIEDCAEAHGARYDGQSVGQFGDIGCFSFYANKLVATGEGGMCVTNSSDLAQSLRILRDHGSVPGRFYWHERVGFNYRMTNIQASIGLAQASRLSETLARNETILALYREALGDLPWVSFPPAMPPPYEPVVWFACVLVPPAKRDAILAVARQRGIEMRPFFHSLSVMPPYAQYAATCPNSAALAECGLNLPTSRQVDREVVDRVARLFREVALM